MNFVAVFLGIDGAIIRNHRTQEVMNIQLGQFEAKQDAIEQAKHQLECGFEINGVLVKGNHQGGFLVCDTQEVAAL